MIQRIQTVYLLIITVLSAVVFFLPVAGLYNQIDNIQYTLDYKGVSLVSENAAKVVYNTWALSAIPVIISILSLITIFLFKKRILQLRLTVFNLVIMLGYYGMLFLYLWLAKAKLNADWHLEFVTAFPLVCIILAGLAMRSISKDEALVRSLNRIR